MEKVKAWFQREWEAVKKSGTMLFAWVQGCIGAVLVVFLDMYQDPTINSAFQSALKPEYIPFYVIGAGLLLRFVRKSNAADL